MADGAAAAAAASATQQLQLANMYASIFSRLQQQQQHNFSAGHHLQQQQHSGGELSPKQAAVYPGSGDSAAVPRLLRQLTVQVNKGERQGEEPSEDHHHHQMPFDLSRRPLSPARGIKWPRHHKK